MKWCGSYETVKYVHIQDARLGALRLVLLIGIVSYVVIVEMAQLGGYLESNSVVGAVRFSLQQPTHNNCDPSTKGCTNAFLPLNELDYCRQQAAVVAASTTSLQAQDNNPTNYTGNVYPCQIYEAANAQVIRETSLVVWTRASTYNQTLVCDGSIESGQMECPQTYDNNDNNTTTSNSDPFYIAQSEAFTVLLEHAVTASRICEHQKKHHAHKKKNYDPHYACSAQADQHLPGRLYSVNDHLCRQEFHTHNNSFVHPTGPTLESDGAPCYIGANRTSKNQDFFSLDVLLQAAGVSLDNCISLDNNKTNSNPCTTYRESGATLLLSIVWNDFQAFHGLVEPFYYYSPQLIGTSYKESIPYYQNYRSSRILFRGHGIKIAVLLGGNFHQFQMLPFLITLTTALGMLAVATTVVDSLMLYVLPEKERYQQVKYERVVGQQEEEEEVLSSTAPTLPSLQQAVTAQSEPSYSSFGWLHRRIGDLLFGGGRNPQIAPVGGGGDGAAGSAVAAQNSNAVEMLVTRLTRNEVDDGGGGMAPLEDLTEPLLIND